MSDFLNEFDDRAEFDKSRFDDSWMYEAVDESADSFLSEIDAEEELVLCGKEFPLPRGSLRDEFIAEVAKIDQRRQRLGKLPVVAGVLMAVSAAMLWPAHDTSTAAVVRRDPLASASLTSGSPEVVAAGQMSDSWALVDAYKNDRSRRAVSIRKSLNGVAVSADQ